MQHILFVVAILIIIVIGLYFKMRETFSDYNAPNEFMKIYYKSIAQDPAFEKKFPFFGTGNRSGLRCRKPGNVGCDTIWVSGQLVELTPSLKKRLASKFGIVFDN